MTSKIIRIEGIIPPYMQGEIARRNKHLEKLTRDTVNVTRQLLNSRLSGPMIPHAVGDGKREVYDAQDGEDRPGVKVRFEGEPDSGNEDADRAYDFTGKVRTYYKEVHGRNSIDGRGMTMTSVVHFRVKFNNAFWDGQMMTYGRGDQEIFRNFVILDICGHEITHGVTQFEGGEEYFGQSGALNESNSDVFGKLIEMYANKTPVEKVDWVLGNGVFMPSINGRGVRDMMKPGTAYNDKKLGKDPQPGHLKDYVKTTRDRGGVHVNSGIANKAFALFATAVGGFAWEAPAHVWFAARAAAGEQPSFGSFAFHAVEACSALGFSKHTDKLVKAWNDVGVTPSQNATDDLTPAPVQSPFPGGTLDDDSLES